MSAVFVSYGREDEIFARQLSAEFSAVFGYSAFVDVENLRAGNSVPTLLDEKIDHCSVFVLICSPYSIRSVWVAYEIGRALTQGKTIMPVLASPEFEVNDVLHPRLTHLQVAQTSALLSQAIREIGILPPPTAKKLIGQWHGSQTQIYNKTGEKKTYRISIDVRYSEGLIIGNAQVHYSENDPEAFAIFNCSLKVSGKFVRLFYSSDIISTAFGCAILEAESDDELHGILVGVGIETGSLVSGELHVCRRQADYVANATNQNSMFV